MEKKRILIPKWVNFQSVSQLLILCGMCANLWLTSKFVTLDAFNKSVEQNQQYHTEIAKRLSTTDTEIAIHEVRIKTAEGQLSRIIK